MVICMSDQFLVIQIANCIYYTHNKHHKVLLIRPTVYRLWIIDYCVLVWSHTKSL